MVQKKGISGHGGGAYTMVADLAGRTLRAAFPAVAGIGLRIHFAAIGIVLVAVRVPGGALRDDARPVGTERAPGVREEGLALQAAGPAVVEIALQVNTGIPAEGIV